MQYQIGDRVELVNEVRGVKVGTQGVVQSVNESSNELVIDLQQNEVVLPVAEQDVKKV